MSVKKWAKNSVIGWLAEKGVPAADAAARNASNDPETPEFVRRRLRAEADARDDAAYVKSLKKHLR